MKSWSERFLWTLPGVAITALIATFLVPAFYVKRPLIVTGVSMTIQGGFAYINSTTENKISLAFMKSYDLTAADNTCQVTQRGVDLLVDDGDVLEPVGWNSANPFDPTGAVVTISAVYIGNSDPRRPTGGPSPADPANGDLDGQWHDTRYVPSVSTYFQGNPLNSNWPTLVDGYFELTQGTLAGGKPTDVAVRHGDWQFKTGPAASPVFNQALTDITTYSTNVLGNEITINMPGAHAGVTKVRVRSSMNRPIHLVLMGKHALGTPTTINQGDPIDHFCSFYQLMNPVPPMSTWLIPRFGGVVGATGATGATGSGTPGAFCPGDGF
jgi:hypothetical protein